MTDLDERMPDERPWCFGSPSDRLEESLAGRCASCVWVQSCEEAVLDRVEEIDDESIIRLIDAMHKDSASQAPRVAREKRRTAKPRQVGRPRQRAPGEKFFFTPDSLDLKLRHARIDLNVKSNFDRDPNRFPKYGKNHERAIARAVVLCGSVWDEPYERKPEDRTVKVALDREANLFLDWLRKREPRKGRGRPRDSDADFRTALAMVVTRRVAAREGRHWRKPISLREVCQVYLLLFNEEMKRDKLKSKTATVHQILGKFVEDMSDATPPAEVDPDGGRWRIACPEFEKASRATFA